MSIYQALCDEDILEKARGLLTQGGFFLRDTDGRITCERSVSWDQPWHHVKHMDSVDCVLWFQIIFNGFSLPLPKEERFVPLGCQDCYKVVVRPKTLKGLFSLLTMQKKLNRPSKCGIETRPSVCGLYGGYFYNRGLEEGLERYKEVRAAVNDTGNLGPDTVVMLKRGCTEMEHATKPSNEWGITDKQLHIESLVLRKFVIDPQSRMQTESIQLHTHKAWIEWAYQNGDMTYLEYTDGKPLPQYPAYVTYHDPKTGENNGTK
jgi:hypothetical protein